MTITIRALTEADIDAVVRLSLRAWAPVFASFEKVLGRKIYRRTYPDRPASQTGQACHNHPATTYAADETRAATLLRILVS